MWFVGCSVVGVLRLPLTSICTQRLKTPLNIKKKQTKFPSSTIASESKINKQ